MSRVAVIGSRRPLAGVGATVRRAADALRAAGVTAVPAAGTEDLAAADAVLVVDPSAWYAGLEAPPPPALLARTVGLCVAPYGSTALADDAQVARLFAAVVHPDRHAVAHLRRVGCTANHVALGCRPGPPPGTAERPLSLMTFGASSPRRLHALAAAADAFDDLPCAHRFDEELPAPDEPGPFAQARVLLDLAADDDAHPDPALWLAAIEAGTAIVTERLGDPDDWPGGGHLTRAPRLTAYLRARELTQDPARAAAQAAAAHRAALHASPLTTMGRALGDLLSAAAAGRAGPVTAPDTPTLSPDAAPPPPPPPPSVAEQLHAHEQQSDAAVRAGVQEILTGMRRLEDRVARLELGPDADTTDVLRRPSTNAEAHVTVLVPAFRSRWTLEATLDSVRAAAAEAGNPPLEIVVVDDASPTDDADTARAWADANPEIPTTVVRHRRNRGLSGARNTALAHATGELVLPLDADDLLRPHGLQRLLQGLTADPDATFAYGILQRFDARGPTGLVGLYPWDPERMRSGNVIPSLALIRRQALVDLGGYADDLRSGYEDWDLWCRIAEAGGHGAWTPQIVAGYRQSPDSMSAALHLSHRAPLADMIARHPELLT